MVSKRLPSPVDNRAHALFFPDGSTAIIDFPEVSYYVRNRAAFSGVDKNGRKLPRPHITVQRAKECNITAIGFPSGAIYPIEYDELISFFKDYCGTTPEGFLTARNPVAFLHEQSKLPPLKEIQTADKSKRGIENTDNALPKKAPSNPIIRTKGIGMTEASPTVVHDANAAEAITDENTAQVENRQIENTQVQAEGTDTIPSRSVIALNAVAGTQGEMPKSKGVFEKPKGWAGLFGSNRAESKGLKIPVITDGVEVDGVYLREEHLRKDVRYELHLLGYFTPRFPGPEALTKVVDTWKSPNCKFYHHASNWIIFTFTNEEDRERVLENGPYFVYGQTLYVKSMPQFFEFDWKTHTTLPVWVQFPRLPLELWSIEAIGRMCTVIGTPHNTDASTKELERMGFARVLIDVDVSFDLPEEIVVHLPNKKMIYQKVFYEDLPKFCKECKKLGHETGQCAKISYTEPKLYVKRPAVRHKLNEKRQNNFEADDGWVQQRGRKNKRGTHTNNVNEQWIEKYKPTKQQLREAAKIVFQPIEEVKDSINVETGSSKSESRSKEWGICVEDDDNMFEILVEEDKEDRDNNGENLSITDEEEEEKVSNSDHLEEAECCDNTNGGALDRHSSPPVTRSRITKNNDKDTVIDLGNVGNTNPMSKHEEQKLIQAPEGKQKITKNAIKKAKKEAKKQNKFVNGGNASGLTL